MTVDNLAIAEQLYEFLQGKVPADCHIDDASVPKLTADQAWTVVWYLGNLYWQVPDYIERCGVCGVLHDTEACGDCLDYGRPPYHFCDECTEGPEAEAKRAARRLEQE